MTILERISKTRVIPGTPATPGTPGRYEWVEDQVLSTDDVNALNAFLGFGVMGGTAQPSGGGSTPTQPPRTGGGSLGGSASYSYTGTSLNGVPGLYIVTVYPDGTHQVIRK